MSDAVRRKSLFTGSVRLCDAAIEMGGQTFVSDLTKSYLEVDFAHGPPAVTVYGETMWPGVVSKCFRSMLHQQVNIGHELQIHDKEVEHDRIIGSVVAVEFPPEPSGGWIIPNEGTQAPCIRAVLGVSKMAEGVAEILAQIPHGHWSVSLEALHFDREAWWLWKTDRGTAPVVEGAVQLNGGWKAIHQAKAPADMNACFDTAKGYVTGKWHNTPVIRMLGGMDGSLHFMGLGVVQAPAEKEAGIRRVLASQRSAATEQLRRLNEQMQGILGPAKK